VFLNYSAAFFILMLSVVVLSDVILIVVYVECPIFILLACVFKLSCRYAECYIFYSYAEQSCVASCNFMQLLSESMLCQVKC
jgi:hypothetical protein